MELMDVMYPLKCTGISSSQIAINILNFIPKHILALVNELHETRIFLLSPVCPCVMFSCS